MKICIPDKLDLISADRKKLSEYPDITIYDDVVNKPETIIERIKDAEIITANYIDITKEIIEQSPKLRYIISPAVGYDWIDVKTSSDHGIKVMNCPTFNTYAVAEHAIALIFAVYRRIVEANRALLRNEWTPIKYIGHEVRGKKILVIGNGNVGKSVLELASGLGITTSYADSKTTGDELERMIPESDIVVLCYPLNDNTRGSFDAHKISLLKKTSIIVNVGRGLLIDQEALYSALKSNKLLGAGLDVFNRDETLQEGREDIVELAKLDNVVATPHIAFNTQETMERFGSEFIANLDAIISGKPINIVN